MNFRKRSYVKIFSVTFTQESSDLISVLTDGISCQKPDRNRRKFFLEFFIASHKLRSTMWSSQRSVSQLDIFWPRHLRCLD